MGRSSKPIKAKPQTPAELAQGRRDVMEDPFLGKHGDRQIGHRHNVRFEVVKEIREGLGIPAPPKRKGRIDWAKHRTKGDMP